METIQHPGGIFGTQPARTLESGLSIVILNRKSGLLSPGRPGSQKCLLGSDVLSCFVLKFQEYHNYRVLSNRSPGAKTSGGLYYHIMHETHRQTDASKGPFLMTREVKMVF